MENLGENYTVMSLGARVFKTIEREILSGTYAPGDSLVETKLSETLGVSRTPVREAMLQLELEGLTKTIPNKGAVVVGFSRRDIEEIYEVRALIDGLAARWAAEKADNGSIKKMGDILALYEFYLGRGDSEKFIELDNQFHDTIYSASKSRILNRTLPSLHNYLQKARADALKSTARSKSVISEHKKILEALSARDGDAAEKAAREHIINAKNNFIENMKYMYIDE